MSRIVINKRKIRSSLILKIILFIFSLVFIFIIVFWFINTSLKFNTVSNYFHSLSKKYDYLFTEIEIIGLDNINEIEINKYFEKYYNKSIFFIPIKKISNNIKKNNWIERVKLKNNFKNKILIDVKEFETIAVYFNGDQYLFIKESGSVIDFADEKEIKKYLILQGKNASIQASKLIQSIPNELKSLIVKAEYINNRRWDIYTKENLRVQLPEVGYKKAMNFFIDIYADLHISDLTKIEHIDLRVSEKAIIKFHNKNIDLL